MWCKRISDLRFSYTQVVLEVIDTPQSILFFFLGFYLRER